MVKSKTSDVFFLDSTRLLSFILASCILLDLFLLLSILFLGPREHGHKEILNILLLSGAKVNVKNINSSTPLHYSIKPGYEEIVEALIRNKADVNYEDCLGSTPIHLAAKECHHEIIKIKVVDILI